MIRNATLADIPEIQKNARTFIDASPYKGLCDDASMEAAAIAMIEDGLCIVDALEDGTHLGGVGCIKGPMFFNRNVMVANERFWWVQPGERGRGTGKALLQAIHQAAKEAGCDYLMMISLPDGQESRTADQMYLKIGMTETEHCFLRKL